MAFAFQRDIDIKLAVSSRKQATLGTALADGLLDESVRMLGPQVPIITKAWRSDKNWIKGDEFAKTLDERAIDIRWNPSFDSNSWILAWAFAFLLGKISTVVTDTTAFTHTITPTAPPTDQPILPFTTIAMKRTADLDKKFADLVVKSVTLSGGNNNDAMTLAVELIGGREATAIASYPALASPEVGPLFNRDMKIFLGTEGSPVDISERIQEWSIQITNNFKEDLAFHPGSGKFRGRFPHGARDATVTLGLFAKDVDDIKTLFDGTTSKEIKFLCEGALAGAATALHTFEARFPATRIVGLEESSGDDFRLHRITVPPEGMFRGGTLTEAMQIRVINKEATYLATS